MISSARHTAAGSARRFAQLAMAIALSVLVTSCQTTSPFETTGSIAPGVLRRAGGLAPLLEAWGQRYRANPNDADAAINYAAALRGNGQRAQAVAVLEQASIANPNHMGVLVPMGARLPTSATTTRRLKCLIALTLPMPPTGAFFQYKALCLTRWAGTRTRNAYHADRAPHRAG